MDHATNKLSCHCTGRRGVLGNYDSFLVLCSSTLQDLPQSIKHLEITQRFPLVYIDLSQKHCRKLSSDKIAFRIDCWPGITAEEIADIPLKIFILAFSNQTLKIQLHHLWVNKYILYSRHNSFFLNLILNFLVFTCSQLPGAVKPAH